MSTIYPGQIFQGYIKPQHGVHEEVRFSYKGLWPEARAHYFMLVNQADGDAAGEAVVFNTMKECITKWNLQYPEHHTDASKRGKPVPITEDAIKSDLMTHVRNHMMNIILFAVASDIDPEAPVASKIKMLEQKASGKSMAELMADADAVLVGN